MKTTILFCKIFFGFLILMSCSNDDDSSSKPISIVGEWKQINQTDICSDGTQSVLINNSCEQMGRLKFNENNSFTWSFYELDESDCFLESTTNGTWELNNGELILVYENILIQNTFFEISENSLKIGDENIVLQDPDPCNNGFVTGYYFEFVRVE